jgi:hypothetical protein
MKTMQVTATTPTTATAYEGPSVFGDDFGSAVATLEVQTAAQSQTVERSVQHAEEETAQDERDRQILAMRQKADDIRTQGWIDGACGVAQGSLEACNTDMAKAGATAVQSTAKVVDAQFAGTEATDDANSAFHAQAADRLEQAAKDAHDAATAEEDTAQKIIESYEQIAQTLASARLAVVQRG